MVEPSAPEHRIPIFIGVIVTGLVVAIFLIIQQLDVRRNDSNRARYQKTPSAPPTDQASSNQTKAGESKSSTGANENQEDTSKRKSDQSGEKKQTVWDPPRFEERRKDRHRMVEEQIGARGIEDQTVLAAMRHVPRHKFVPPQHAASAYEDHPLPIGHGQTISQPYIVGFMTDLLELDEKDRVLEIGTGSAYQAAVLAELTPHVYTIEIIEELAAKARKRLNKLGYDTVKVKTGDGYFGWKKHAPFDAIIVTAAAGHIPSPLLKQLKKGGRMIIPVGGAYETQYLVLVRKGKDGTVRSKQLMPVRFVPMTGRAQEAE